ncbi:hypothetical protein PPROV_000990000 [Pycnococcus provasolii]|uniref:Matrin-type domain-containing protein n=1 Tax=Pycnococcus provasolii TaxID=41880 RepID=A0A830HZA5_9CHLO|nr:hypothetical protein PPROV_000990000 [Pycnococcus provasolii]|mmetsp:Transcript_5873/g.13285  ORF Transcript_5873/g.13285 Transcript_5873/m.13285 type:complete len:256 (+) Transcript_5873:62-829(+)
MSFMAARQADGVGSKVGSGGVASSAQTNVDRRERLRRLAMETIDLRTDPYFLRNHVGQYECRLCLTVHKTEGNYLAHTQGRRHQQNLAKRSARDAFDKGQARLAQVAASASAVPAVKTPKIGRPGYRVTKQVHPSTGALSLLFQVDLPEADADANPRHRILSAFEQKIDAPPDGRYQYICIACAPYETIAFKVPNMPIDGANDLHFSHWDADRKVLTLQICFVRGARAPAFEDSAPPLPGMRIPMAMLPLPPGTY